MSDLFGGWDLSSGTLTRLVGRGSCPLSWSFVFSPGVYASAPFVPCAPQVLWILAHFL